MTHPPDRTHYRSTFAILAVAGASFALLQSLVAPALRDIQLDLHTSTTGSTSTTVKPTSQDITGSEIVPFRGKLLVAVSAAGRLSLAYKGKPVSGLRAGRYSIAAVDRSTSSGLMLAKLSHAAVTVTGKAFVGKRTTSVVLTSGKWLFMPRAGQAAFSIPVS